MPRCRDRWVRPGPTRIRIKATCQDPNVFYQLSYTLQRVSEELPVLAGGSFTSGELTAGAGWEVPAGYKSDFTLISTGNKPIETEIEFDGQPAECNPGRHCQGACVPSGPAGIAGDWDVTAAPEVQ